MGTPLHHGNCGADLGMSSRANGKARNVAPNGPASELEYWIALGISSGKASQKWDTNPASYQSPKLKKNRKKSAQIRQDASRHGTWPNKFIKLDNDINMRTYVNILYIYI